MTKPIKSRDEKADIFAQLVDALDAADAKDGDTDTIIHVTPRTFEIINAFEQRFAREKQAANQAIASRTSSHNVPFGTIAAGDDMFASAQNEIAYYEKMSIAENVKAVLAKHEKEAVVIDRAKITTAFDNTNTAEAVAQCLVTTGSAKVQTNGR